MAFYDEASAWIVSQNSDPFSIPKNVKFPIGSNRRNLYGGQVVRHLESLREQQRSAKDWPTHNFEGVPTKDWGTLKTNLGAVWGNGRFATFTTAEMLQKVNDVPVEITGFDNEGSSAPADGLCRMFKCERVVSLLDKYGERVYKVLQLKGMKPFYTDLDRGVVESILCNLSAICRGRFYSGRNVDRQQGKIIAVEKLGYNLDDLWAYRSDVFPTKYLGEFQGWVGINKPRMRHYQLTGEVLWADELR